MKISVFLICLPQEQVQLQWKQRIKLTVNRYNVQIKSAIIVMIGVEHQPYLFSVYDRL
jgi:hypothetical protein